MSKYEKVGSGINIAIICSLFLAACSNESQNPKVNVDPTQIKPSETLVLPVMTATIEPTKVVKPTMSPSETEEWVKVISPLDVEVPDDYKKFVKENRMKQVEIDGDWYMRPVSFLGVNKNAPEEYPNKFKWNKELSEWEVYVPENVPLFYTKDMDLNLMYEIAKDRGMQSKQLEILSVRYAKLMSVDQLVPMKLGGQEVLLRYNGDGRGGVLTASDGIPSKGGGFVFIQEQFDYVNSNETLLMPLKIQGIDIEEAFVGIFPMLLGDKEILPMFVLYEDGIHKYMNKYMKERDFFTYLQEDVLSKPDSIEGDVINQTLRLYFNKQVPDQDSIPVYYAIKNLNNMDADWLDKIKYAITSYGSNQEKNSEVRELLSHALFSAYYLVTYFPESIDM